MMNKITDTVKHLIIINAIMFLGTMTVGNGQSFYQWFSLYFPKNNLFEPWQIISHMFMHGGIAHLLFNMFALWMFGTAVEQVLGWKKFLFIYLSAGFGAVIFQLGYYYFDFYKAYQGISDLGMNTELLNKIININALEGNFFKGQLLAEKMEPLFYEYGFDTTKINSHATAFTSLFNMNVVTASRMVGASGCIMGLLAAFGMMNPEAKLMMIFLPIPIKAKYFIPGIIILDVVSAITGQSFFSPSNTAYMAHVGGALTGFIIMWYWKKTQFNKNRWN